MRIENLDTFIVGNPPPSFGGRYFIFTKLTTSNGVVGYGECYNASVGPKAMVAVIEDLFERYVEGASPFETEKLFRLFYSSGFSQRPDPTIMGAFSAIEMACWDIAGKALEQPIYNLLGGKINERLRSYTYLYPDETQDPAAFYNDPDASAECALKYVEQGFTAVKFDSAGAYTIQDPHQPTLYDLERSKSFCKTIRSAVGERADLLFGTHGQFSVSGAIRMAQILEPFKPLWFEEPVPPGMPEEMAQVARATSVPISTGERLATKYEFAQVLRAGAASILQPDLGRSGGILETKKIAAMAEGFYAHIAPHLYCGPLVALANIQLSATLPNFLILESIQAFDGFYADLLSHPIHWEDGYVIPSSRPGLGADLNEEVARAHPYDGDQLHLEMQVTPTSYDNDDDQFAGG